ncbi:hypothetical protein NQZ68_024301 [Dissostichus eleginoides]|nr:hypothetical protein NQZ68_024301 [Dissostichus eleginoides]
MEITNTTFPHYVDKGHFSKPSSSFRCRLLKEAVIRRRSEGFILQGTNPASSPQQTPAVTTQPQPPRQR